MNRILRRRPSPATAIALTALIVAVGGAAYATIPDSTVQLRASCMEVSTYWPAPVLSR